MERKIATANAHEWTRRKNRNRGLAQTESAFAASLDPPGSPAELYTRHSPPRRIGEVAKASGARHLILTHIPPPVDKAPPKVSASIQAADPEAVLFAEDKMRVAVE